MPKCKHCGLDIHVVDVAGIPQWQHPDGRPECTFVAEPEPTEE